MNKPVKSRLQLWVAALRSGKYKQGRRALRPTKGTWCCLGVGVDVFRKETRKGKWKFKVPYSALENRFLVGDSDNGGLMPPEVASWYGVGANPVLEAKVGTVTGAYTCTALNDREYLTFDQIADALECVYELKKKHK